VDCKSCDIDLVTETDKQVEELIISNLKSQYPDHRYAFHISTSYIACIPDFMRKSERRYYRNLSERTDNIPVS
jgi:hypothetical protein